MRSPEPQVRIMDIRGLFSPQPVLALADEAERVGPGETFGILSDDPDSKADFLDWCGAAGIDIIELTCLPGGVDRFVFRRPPVTDTCSRQDPQTPPEWWHAA